MAQRPIFIPLGSAPWVRQRMVAFTWHAGMALSQKQKSITSLHSAARSLLHLSTILEISSKSKDPEGVAASAFNLIIELPDGVRAPLECAYQGSKKFTSGGPHTDIYCGTALDAKRDERVKGQGGRLVSFDYFGLSWPLEPVSLFYDWLYVSALTQPQNGALLAQLLAYEAFTDIEFNPEKSVSCQANSAALIVGMSRAGLDLTGATEPSGFRTLVAGSLRLSGEGQAQLF